jgi:hypothetical protein
MEHPLGRQCRFRGSRRAAKADAAIHDACSLVSLADAESILGTPAKLSEHAQDDKQSLHYNYGSVDQPHGFNGLMVGIETEEDANEAKTFMAVQRQRSRTNASPACRPRSTRTPNASAKR